MCNETHLSRCNECDKVFDLFTNLYVHISETKHHLLEEKKDYLYYYWSHQVRKIYLNSQFQANLLEIDNEGAVIIADYKMRILPKSARETKENFYAKRGWTLHTILVFIKSQNADEELELTAYDHWSNDTKQDAWFTASSFDLVFSTLSPKPKWIKVITDNGPHYHCSELMVIAANWHDWYGIEIREWTFLEPGEAKTTIDSHHASVILFFFNFIIYIV